MAVFELSGGESVMKKRVSVLLILIICIFSALPVSAAFTNPSVTDLAGLLTPEEAADVEAKLDALREEYDFDVAIYTEEVMSGDSAMETADDIFDYSGYGGGEDADGIMLYLSAEPRKYWLTTHGVGITVFNNNGLSYLKDEIVPFLQEDDYYNAFLIYVDRAELLLQMAADGEPYNESHMSLIYIICVVAAALLLPLLAAYIAMSFKLSLMHTAVKQDDAKNYMKPGSMSVDVSRDIFLYSTVIKTPRPKSTDSDTHTSSSGETHGGSGGSY